MRSLFTAAISAALSASLLVGPAPAASAVTLDFGQDCFAGRFTVPEFKRLQENMRRKRVERIGDVKGCVRALTHYDGDLAYLVLYKGGGKNWTRTSRVRVLYRITGNGHRLVWAQGKFQPKGTQA